MESVVESDSIIVQNQELILSEDSWNPENMTEKQCRHCYKNLCQIEVTQTEKYSDLWVAKDGRLFEMNQYETFDLVNSNLDTECNDSGLIRDRLDCRYGDWKLSQDAELIDLYESYYGYTPSEIQGTDGGFKSTPVDQDGIDKRELTKSGMSIFDTVS
jgi:hypothetical protein